MRGSLSIRAIPGPSGDAVGQDIGVFVETDGGERVRLRGVRSIVLRASARHTAVTLDVDVSEVEAYGVSIEVKTS